MGVMKRIATARSLGTQLTGSNAVTVEGLTELVDTFKRLEDKTAKSLMAAGVRASLTNVARAMRKAVNASSASSGLKRAARKQVGSRFRKGGLDRMGRQHAVVAKVGFAVGKKATLERAEGRGVGISERNVHWAVLGTDERKHKSGHPTGRMPALLAGITEQALASSRETALAAAREAIKKASLKQIAAIRRKANSTKG